MLRMNFLGALCVGLLSDTTVPVSVSGWKKMFMATMEQKKIFLVLISTISNLTTLYKLLFMNHVAF